MIWHQTPRGLAATYFSGEVLKDGCTINSCCCSYTAMTCCAGLQVPVDTTHWELAGGKGTGYELHFNITKRQTVHPDGKL